MHYNAWIQITNNVFQVQTYLELYDPILKTHLMVKLWLEISFRVGSFDELGAEFVYLRNRDFTAQRHFE